MGEWNAETDIGIDPVERELPILSGPSRLLAWMIALRSGSAGRPVSDLDDWSQVSGLMVADHRLARASAIVAATNASFAFL